jgi:hypothetical protein
MSRKTETLSARALDRTVRLFLGLAVGAAASLVPIPALAQDQLLFNADFGAQPVGVPLPSLFDATGAPDVVGDFVVLDRAEQNGNTIRVQASPGGGFPTNSLRIRHPQGFGSNPSAEFHPPTALGPYGSGLFTVTWRASVEQPSHFSLVALVSPGGASAFTVNHTFGAGGNPRIAFQSATGATVTTIPYVANVPQTFRAVVRMAKKTFDLYVDEVQVACGRPFQHQTFDAISHLVALVQPPPANPNPEVMALDDVRIVRRGGSSTNTPPVLAAIASQTASEGQPLQFTVSASDCDGDTLTLSAGNLPSGASFAQTGPTTGLFSWTPDSSQAGLYYVTFQVSDGLATDSQEVPIAVENTLVDTDLDGVPDAVDNCPDRWNRNQSDVDQNGVGDACDNAFVDQVALALTTDLSSYLVGQPVLVRPSLTVSLDTGCKTIRNVDGQSVTLRLFNDAGQVPQDQIPEGEALAIPLLVEACAGSPLTLSGEILLNGPEGHYLSLPAGVYRLLGTYDSRAAKDPDVNAQGQCVPTDPTEPCDDILQVESLEAQTTFIVQDPSGALAEADTLCAFITSQLVTDPNTRKSLLGKCRAVRDKIARGSIGAACNDLRAFINEVQNILAQRKITQAQATILLDKAGRIKALLVCP